MSRSQSWSRAAALAVWLLAGPTLAQDAPDADEPSGEGSEYAHVRFAEGRATLIRAYDGEPLPLDLNLPVVPGDRLEAADGGLLEIQLADGSVLRGRGPLTLDVHALAGSGADSGTLTRLALQDGDISLEVHGYESTSERTYQIDTPYGSAYALTDGSYRISVRPDGAALVAVREGVAEVDAADSSVLVRSGQASRLQNGDGPSDPSARLARPDDFDAWVGERRGDVGTASPEEAPEAISEALPEPVRPYADDLSRYGRWDDLPTYGTAWIPAGVGPGWFPYYNGYWVSSPAGRLWVSYEPWGWAPYHYGSWEWVAGVGWAWIPGPSFAGAWVVWWPGPTYVAWVPRGFYGRPAIDFGVYFSSGYRTPRAGLACVSYQSFYSRDLPRRYVRDERVLRIHAQEAVVVPRLPAFRERDLRMRPGLGSEVFAQARRIAETPPRRTFHPATPMRPVSLGQPSRPVPAPLQGGGRSLPPRSTVVNPVPRGRVPMRATPVDSGAPRRFPGEPASSRPLTARPLDEPPTAPPPAAERRVRELLHQVARPSPPAAAPGRDTAARPLRPRDAAPRAPSAAPRGGPNSEPRATGGSRPARPKGQSNRH